jgi:hypothetical protein
MDLGDQFTVKLTCVGRFCLCSRGFNRHLRMEFFGVGVVANRSAGSVNVIPKGGFANGFAAIGVGKDDR